MREHSTVYGLANLWEGRKARVKIVSDTLINWKEQWGQELDCLAYTFKDAEYVGFLKRCIVVPRFGILAAVPTVEVQLLHLKSSYSQSLLTKSIWQILGHSVLQATNHPLPLVLLFYWQPWSCWVKLYKFINTVSTHGEVLQRPYLAKDDPDCFELKDNSKDILKYSIKKILFALAVFLLLLPLHSLHGLTD